VRLDGVGPLTVGMRFETSEGRYKEVQYTEGCL
jgi:hypothetical protein